MIPSDQQCQSPARNSRTRRSIRIPFLIGTVALTVVVVGVLLRIYTRSMASMRGVESDSAPLKLKSDPPHPVARKQQAFEERALAEGEDSSKQTPKAAIPASPPGAAQLQPSDETRQLVSALVQPGIAVTQEQATHWKGSLEQLVQQGPAAVPAMREFLARNVDLDFGPDGVRMFGYPSVRTAMIDALQQIGGPDAVSLMLQTMQTTTDPREIALLAQILEQQAPAQYRQEVIYATRETLAMASQGKLDGRDVGPLFEVLQKVGDAAVVTDLEQAAGNWNYYAAWALAQLPDGAGIPALIQMAGNPDSPAKGNSGVALEMLARVATQYPEAESALLELTRQNKISPKLWPYLASSLTGEKYHYLDSASGGAASIPGVRDLTTIHVNFGNQNLYSTGLAGLNPDQINRQVSFIDQLLSATKDPAAAEPLQRSRDTLLKRLPQTAAITLPARR